MKVLAIAGLLSLPCLGAMHVAMAASAEQCRIYDGTTYTDKPANRRGVLDIQIAYEGDLWDPRHRDAPMPWRAKVEAAARTARARNVPLVLDIERWHVDSTATDEEVRSRVAKLTQIVGWARATAPEIQLGYFSLAPMAASSWAQAAEGSKDLSDWRRINERLRPLAESVDIIFPYSYTYLYNPDDWQAQAIGNIREARRYGKPVYLFIWPQYTERNKQLSYTFVPSEFWRRQLATACEYADAVVIWGGWDPQNRRHAAWDENATWWRDVQAFKGIREQ